METKTPKNQDLGKTQITDKIRVSSAAIYYNEWEGERYQYETWIFSSDERQKSTQAIHGSSFIFDGEMDENMVEKTKEIHTHISNNMLKIWNNVKLINKL